MPKRKLPRLKETKRSIVDRKGANYYYKKKIAALKKSAFLRKRGYKARVYKAPKDLRPDKWYVKATYR
jgi:hypothetical protein